MTHLALVVNDKGLDIIKLKAETFDEADEECENLMASADLSIPWIMTEEEATQLKEKLEKVTQN